MHIPFVLSLSLLAAAQPPSGAADSGLAESFARSGPMAKVVLAILVGFSLVSWAIMLWKVLQLRQAERQSARFLDTFRHSKRFSEVSAMAPRVHSSPLFGIFQAGYAEIDSQIKSQEPSGANDPKRYRIRSLTSVERSLRRALAAELGDLARGSHFLATTAAATPFIGLFGTVWGIMSSFQQIGATGSTSLDAIAPGIAEALINTAAGLGAAIPALVGYNFLAHRLRRLRAGMEDFVSEFLNLTERNFTA